MSPFNFKYIAKKLSAGGRGRVRQHPASFPLHYGVGLIVNLPCTVYRFISDSALNLHVSRMPTASMIEPAPMAALVPTMRR